MQNQNTLLLNRQTGEGVSYKLVFDMQIIPVGRECKSVTGVMIYNAELVTGFLNAKYRHGITSFWRFGKVFIFGERRPLCHLDTLEGKTYGR